MRWQLLAIAVFALSASPVAAADDPVPGVTILRGSSAPPAPPPPSEPKIVVQREVIYTPALQAYAVPIFIVSRTRHVPISTIPSGWPLLGATRR